MQATLLASFDDAVTGGREQLIAETESFRPDQIEWLESAARFLKRAPAP